MKLKKKVVITRKEYVLKKKEIKTQISEGTIEEDKATEVLVLLKQRRAKIIKIGRKTFETSV